MLSPLSSMRALTRPQAAPATTWSPTRRVPFCTMTVATGPLPGSRLASSTMPRGRALGVGPQLLDLGHDQQLLQQVVDAEVLEGGDLDHDRVAAPSLGYQPELGELLHDVVGVGVGPVDLVDGDDDGDVGRLGVVQAPRRSGA